MIKQGFVEQAVAISEPAANRIMLTGAGIGIGGGLSDTTILAIGGFLVMLLGLIWQRVDVHRKDRREARESKLRVQLLEQQIAALDDISANSYDIALAWSVAWAE